MTSDVCPICGGLGWIYNPQNNSACECDCYKEQLKRERLKFAMIPSEFRDLTVASFDTSLYRNENLSDIEIDVNEELAKKAKSVAKGYVNKFEIMQEQGKGLFLYSKKRGSGKTRLAISIGNALIKTKQQRVRFITTIDLLGQIKATYNRDKNNDYTEQELFEEFSEIPVLILDDMGTEKASTFVTEVFFRLLDNRMTHKKITIVTSNLEIDELAHDERIKSRLRKMTARVKMPEIDVRSKLAQQENDSLLAMLMSS